MRKIYIVIAFVLASCFAACTDSTLDGVGQEQEVPVNQVPEGANEGELLIKFKPEVTEMLDQMQTRTRGVMTRSGIPTMDQVLDVVGGYSFERVFPIDKRHENRTRECGLHLWYVVRFSKDADLKKVAEDLALVGEISAIQFNTNIKRGYNPNIRPTVVSKQSMSATRAAADGYPFNDPKLPMQWGLINRGNIAELKGKDIAGCDVQVEEAWKKGIAGNPSIIVAVFDEGVMYSHEDLKDNMWVNEGESDIQSLKDNDKNGYIGDRYGYNFVNNSGVISCSDPADTGHGTHVAGIIAATNNNEKGISSVAGGTGSGDGVRIMSCQLMSGNKTASMLNEARAFKYAADNGAVIAQCSWGYNSGLANPIKGFVPGPTTEKIWSSVAQIEKEAVDYFVHNAGSPNGVIEGGLAIFASGNESAAMGGFPGAYESCISVAAVAADFTPSTYTNYDQFVDISAPGGDSFYHEANEGMILSTIPNLESFNKTDEYGYMEGTSMACPYVCGVAALGLSYAYDLRRHFKADEFRALLISSVTPLTQYGDMDEKFFWENWPNSPQRTSMSLTPYKGRVGGLVNVQKLLAAIDKNNSEMVVPNVYVAPDKTVKMDLAKFFVEGETLQYTCTVGNTSIATVTVDNTLLTVKGLKVGTTKAKVQVTGGKAQDILITVRQGAGENGWM